jgi:hypothetical protein
MGSHKDVGVGGNHIPHNYSNATLDAAQSYGFSAEDVSKIGKITDSDTYYIVKNSSGDLYEFTLRELKEVQTVTTASETELFSLDTTIAHDDYTFIVHCFVQGTVSGGGNAAGYVRTAMFKNDSGTLSQVGSTSPDFTAEDDSNWDCQVETDGGTEIRVNVTGDAGSTIDWLGRIFIGFQKNS